jgi:ATP-dependent DNA helicase DinG
MATDTPLTDLQQQVQACFEPHGLLAQTIEAFQPRQGQTDMALAVADTLHAGGALVVEAGTGVGKTFAYLVPALLSGERVLLSTATKALQDQLFSRDLPRLVKALNLPVRLALLKGRSSYLCTHRLDLARRDATLPDRHAVQLLAKVERWALTTRSGDLGEVPGLEEGSSLVPFITSTRDNCLGSECPQFKTCHVNAARREALAADVVVINHHLFFADLLVRETGMAELLPTVRVVIFDEAHQLNETGVQFLGRQLSSGQIIDFTRDVLAAGLQHARGLVDWQSICAGLEKAARDLRLIAGPRPASNLKLRWAEHAPEGVPPADWQKALDYVHHACVQTLQALDSVSELAPDFVRLRERAQTMADLTELFLAPCEAGEVRWVDVNPTQLRVMQAPLDIADTVREKLLSPGLHVAEVDAGVAAKAEFAPQDTPLREAARRSWIFTSATLGDDPRLRWFTEPCGLSEARILRVGSPFDYAQQASLYVPRRMVRPNEPEHSPQVAQFAVAATKLLGGRTLVLTTTLRALRLIGEQMKQQLTESAIEVLVQGEWPKRYLMERFRSAPEDGGKPCVLVASASFWEGFDVPGEALQLVIIDKLPFPPPNDPVVEARSQRLQHQGRSPFNDYFVPEAAVALKQGAGRLIRRESDRGALVICDTRLVETGYGRRLLAALPPMQLLHEPGEMERCLRALATPVTKSSVTKSSTTTSC